MTGGPQTATTTPEHWGPLKILGHLASCEASEVYRARDPVLDRDVALKLFNTRDENEHQLLLDEGRRMSRIRHPNIIQVQGSACHDGQVGFWMELVEGSSLGELLEAQGPMSIGTRLMGFGPDLGGAGVAPELLAGDPPSRQSDIYALGTLLKRLTAGAPEADDDENIIATQFGECLAQATAQDPAERFTSAKAFAKALTRAGKKPPSRVRRILGITLILVMAAFVIMQWPSQYRFESDLYRVNPDQSWTRLADGAAVGAGDRLVLEVTTTVPMYVFVFGEDVRGNAWGLFPLYDAGHANPLRANETHTLPAEGDDAPTWVITAAAELRRIHIVAIPEEVPEFERLNRGLPVPGEADISSAAIAPLVRAARMLDEEAEFAIGVTYRVIELHPPDN